MKKLFATLFTIGFVLAIGSATTSDLEAKTHKNMITENQFVTQIVISLSLVSIGAAGFITITNKQNNERTNYHGQLYPKKVPNYASVGDTYYTRTRSSYETPRERSAG